MSVGKQMSFQGFTKKLVKNQCSCSVEEFGSDS